MTLALRIAERIHALRFDDITPMALDWVRAAFVDTIGVTLAGMAEDAPRLLLQVPGTAAAPGPSLILASGIRTTALDAALVNGVASHALDYDDVAGALGGHPSVPLIPPLLALGEMLGSSGRDLVLAYVVGFETECRIARGVHFHHYDKGWHPTATLGIFGTVAAAARLLRLTMEQTATALGLAASFASGLKANFGTMTKPLHVGQTARNGLFAALLAQQGFTANAGALEHKQGFLEVFNGAGTYDTTRILADWYAPLECEAGEPALKPYPCCGSTHAAIDRMLDLARRHALRPEQVATIDVMPHARRLPHTDNPDPRTPLAAKFSIQYCVARALVDGSVRLQDFESEAHLDPRVRAVMARIQARPHPELSADATRQWGAEVVVTTTDGRCLASRIDRQERRAPDAHPMGRDELWVKFADCAGRVLPPGQLAPAFERLLGIEALARPGDLTQLLQLPGAAAQAA